MIWSRFIFGIGSCVDNFNNSILFGHKHSMNEIWDWQTYWTGTQTQRSHTKAAIYINLQLWREETIKILYCMMLLTILKSFRKNLSEDRNFSSSRKKNLLDKFSNDGSIRKSYCVCFYLAISDRFGLWCFFSRPVVGCSPPLISHQCLSSILLISQFVYSVDYLISTQRSIFSSLPKLI